MTRTNALCDDNMSKLVLFVKNKNKNKNTWLLWVQMHIKQTTLNSAFMIFWMQ